MLVHYLYRDCSGKHGWFQADQADAMQCFNALRRNNELYWFVVSVSETTFSVWSASCRRWYRSGFKWWFTPPHKTKK